MTVLVPNDGPFRAVGERIANSRGEEICTSFDEVPDTGSVIYVDAPDRIDEATLLALQQRMHERGPVEGGFSVVTGPTPDDALDFYERETSYEDEHGLLLWNTPDDFDPDDQTTLLSEHDLTASNVADLAEDGLSSLSARIHGWTIHLHLREGYVCGFPSDPDEWSFDGQQPHCVQDGRKECPFDEELVAADEIDASHVFLRTCASTINNNKSSLPVHAPLGLLSGAESVIGPYRTNSGYPHEVLLHHSLLRAGYDVRERCYLLNRNGKLNDIAYLIYVPFGSPDAGFEPATEHTPDAQLQTDGHDLPTLQVTDVDNYVIDVTLPTAELPSTTDRYYLRQIDSTDDFSSTTYYAAFEEGDDLRVVIYSGTRMQAESLSFEIDANPIHQRKREVARKSLNNAQRLENFDLLTSKASDQLDNLWHQVRNLPVSISDERYKVRAYDRAKSKIREPFGNINGIRDQLLSTLSEGSRLHDNYAYRAIDHEVYASEDSCTYCGRPVAIKHISDGDRTERLFGVCPRCGYIYDVPTEGRTVSPTYPVVEKRVDEPPYEISVHFENPTDDELDATLFPVVLDLGDTFEGDPIFEPRYAEVEVGAGEQVDVSFGVDVDGLEPNQHYILAHVIANLEIYSATTSFVVGDRPGRRHRRY